MNCIFSCVFSYLFSVILSCFDTFGWVSGDELFASKNYTHTTLLRLA